MIQENLRVIGKETSAKEEKKKRKIIPSSLFNKKNTDLQRRSTRLLPEIRERELNRIRL